MFVLHSTLDKETKIIMCEVSRGALISLSTRRPLYKVYMSRQSQEENGDHLY